MPATHGILFGFGQILLGDLYAAMKSIHVLRLQTGVNANSDNTRLARSNLLTTIAVKDDAVNAGASATVH